MSVKFERETIRETTAGRGASLGASIKGSHTSKHEIAHEIGERLTGGESTKGYLAVRSLGVPFSIEEHHSISGNILIK